MDKNANDFVFVGDGSYTDQAIEKELRGELIPYRLRVTFIAEKRLDRVLARLRDLPGKYLFLTTLGGMTDVNGQVLSLRDILKSLVHTGRIVISMEDAYIIESVLGGHVTSGQKQGLNAARLLLAYLHGKPIVDLLPILKSPNALIFDDRALQQLGIDLPEDLRSQAVLFHPRLGYYERHRSLLLGMLIGSAALLFSVVTMSLFSLFRKNRQITNASRQLAASETRLHTILDAEPECVKIIGPDGTLRQINPAGLAMMESGDNPAKVLGKEVVDLVVPEHRDAFTALTRRVLKGERGTLEFEIVGLKGTRRWLETHAVPLREASGEIVLLAVTRDITVRKQYEESLQRSEERLKEAQHLAHLGSWELNLKEGRLFWSDEAFRIFEIDPERFGRSNEAFLALVHPEARDFVDHAYTESVAARTPYSIDHRLLFSDGRVKNVHERCQTFYDADGTPLRSSGTVQDITDEQRHAEEKTRLEDQLRQIQKVEAVGRLAGGVAHDFNNLTAIVLGDGEMLLGQFRPEDPARNWAEQIVEAGRRSAALTRQFLAFSRKQVLQPEVLDLNALLLNLEKMLGRLIGEDIEFTFTPAAGLGRVKADPGQIEQVVTNLVVNARDAMPSGGRLTIETGNVVLGKTYASGHESIVPGEYVMLAMTDTGCGMDKATMARLFEPFFTTKEKGKGTGLGLSSVYGIVKQTGGYIYAYSEPGEGTTFKIYLPRTDAEPDEKTIDAGEEVPRGRGELILLVEDEASLRLLCETTLTQLGYRVCAAGTGREAQLMVEEKGIEPDLVVTDVIMPGMSGAELADLHRGDRPGLRVLYMSGYPDDAIARYGVLEPGTLFIQKPFTERSLAGKVREVLAGKTVAARPGRRILMIDDDEQYRDLVRHFCTKRGHDFAGVDSAAAALEALAGQPFDVLLIDMSIPGTSGARVLRALRAAGCAAPAIVLTGDVASADMDALRPLGAVRALEKSSNGEPLLQVIEETVALEDGQRGVVDV